MRRGDHCFPDLKLASWNVNEDRLYHRYFSANFLKLLTTAVIPVGQFRSADC